MEAFGENMLDETPYELLSGESHGLPLIEVTTVLVAEGYVSVVDGDDPVIGDGDTVDIACEIVQDFVSALDRGFAFHYPVDVPNRVWEGDIRESLASHMHELSAEDNGEGFNWDQEVVPSCKPGGVVWQEATCRNQAMDVRMEDEGLGPCVEHGEESDLSSDVVRISGKFHNGGGSGFDEDIIEYLLVGTYDVAELLRQGEYEMIVEHGQEVKPSFLDPPVGIL